MNRDLFVQNVKARCKALGIPQTTACAESGAGSSLLSEVKKGKTPSIDRVEKLAAYLGCTVSDLLGETSSPRSLPLGEGAPQGRMRDPSSPPEATEGVPTIPDDPIIQEIMSRVRDLTPDQQRLYLAQLRALEAEEKQ